MTTEEDNESVDAKIVILYKEGATIRQIASMYGIHPRTVSSILYKNEVPIRNSHAIFNVTPEEVERRKAEVKRKHLEKLANSKPKPSVFDMPIQPRYHSRFTPGGT